jgi:hypothetical protein
MLPREEANQAKQLLSAQEEVAIKRHVERLDI